MLLGGLKDLDNSQCQSATEIDSGGKTRISPNVENLHPRTKDVEAAQVLEEVTPLTYPLAPNNSLSDLSLNLIPQFSHYSEETACSNMDVNEKIVPSIAVGTGFGDLRSKASLVNHLSKQLVPTKEALCTQMLKLNKLLNKAIQINFWRLRLLDANIYLQHIIYTMLRVDPYSK